MTKFIALVSGKGGTGKTLTAINLATALNNFGRDVTVVDANFNTPNIGLFLGASLMPHTLNDVLDGKKKLQDALYEHPSGLKLIPSNISYEKMSKTKIGNLKKVIHSLRGKTDIVILDTPSSLTNETKEVVKIADEVIIVTNPELPAVTDALKALHFSEEDSTVVGVVLNKVRNIKSDLDKDNVEVLLERPVIASVPHDNNVRHSIKTTHPVVYSHPNSPSSIAFKKLAATLVGETYIDSKGNPKESLVMKLVKIVLGW